MARLYRAPSDSLIHPRFTNPQNQIRLLRVLPEDDKNPTIACEIEVCTLEPDLAYAALINISNKPSRNPHPLVVNGQYVLINDSMHAALDYIRKYRVLHVVDEFGGIEILPLWVHGLCVNDENKTEISQQASQFGPLLGGAYKVLCWLGLQEHPNYTRTGETALRAIQDIAEAAFGEDNELNSLGLREVLHDQWNLSFPADGSLLPVSWEAISYFFRLPLWNKTWTTQAMVLAKSPGNLFFVCGEEAATWGEISQFLNALDHIQDVASRRSSFFFQLPLKDLIRRSVACGRVGHIRLMRNQWVKSGSVAPGQIFKFSLGCDSRHPNHYVFGFQAISSRKVTMDDYWNTAAAYTQWWDHVLEENDPSILAYASGVFPDDGTHPEPFSLPSWVPDLASYHKRPSELLVTPYWGAWYVPFTRPRERIDHNDKTLHIHGVKLNDSVMSSFQLFPTHAALGTQLAYHCLAIAPLEWNHPSGIALMEAFFHTFISVLKLDQDSNAFPLSCLEATIEHLAQITAGGFEALHREHQYPGNPRDVATAVRQQFHHVYRRIMLITNSGILPEGPVPTQGQVLERIEQLRKSAVFLTRKGYIGIGPVGLSIGDEVCILNECSSAMLMRSVPNSPNFIYVGPCFMYGLSSFSIQEWIRSGEIEVEELTIQ